MPFQSKAQMKFMYSEHPDIAARWEREHHQSGKGLPEHVQEDRPDMTLFNITKHEKQDPDPAGQGDLELRQNSMEMDPDAAAELEHIKRSEQLGR